MSRSFRSLYWLSSNFQKRPSVGSRLSSRLSNFSTNGPLKIDNSVRGCPKNDIFLLFFDNKLSESPFSIDLAIFLLCILLIPLVDLVVGCSSWCLVHDLRLFHSCCGFLLYFLLNCWGFCCSFLVYLGAGGRNWLLEGTFLQFLKVFPLCDLDIWNHSISLCRTLRGVLCLLLLLDDLTSVNLEGNLHKESLTLAVVKNFSKFSVTLSNWCNFL